ncbi:hypothetical protein HYALB_00013961 [Hymenoscyphus albidus]|uniref:Uncharacterized protein n=1 Tax=Hymenoscyphus albidus TaxID=595503 RepID=A0A9N9M0C3_9HELO|nr:hypothetical protein HYALB_00013961 [Hymenoscyphus albidus]
MAAKTGEFPGNRNTELPLWPADQMQYMSIRYVDWATAPYTQIPAPGGVPGDFIARAFENIGLGPKTPEQIAARMKSMDLARSPKLLGTRVPFSPTCKTHPSGSHQWVWYGLSPMSDAHWKAKGLDEECHIEEALSVLQSVVGYIEYTQRPNIVGKRRNAFNKICGKLGVFQDACNALHATRGQRMPGWDLTKLWQEYIRCLYEFQQYQARAWLFTHLLTLQKHWKDRLVRGLSGGRVMSATQGTIRVCHLSIFILNKIQDLYAAIDILVHKSTDGYLMAQGIDPRFSGVTEIPAARINEIH